MGIMYKLLKHKDLSMDLSKHKVSEKMKKVLTIEGNIVSKEEEHEKMETDDEQQQLIGNNKDHKKVEVEDKTNHFTAEHILQLCKFLAEKSRRNVGLLFKSVFKEN